MSPLRLEDVLNGVIEEALEEFRSKIREIEEEGLRRLREEGEELRRQAAAASQALQRESNAARMRLVSQASLEARREYLESVENCVNTVVSEALRRISSLKESRDYTFALKALLREAIEIVGGDDVVVEPAKDDVSLVNEAVREVGRELGVKITLSTSTLESVGGVRVRNRDASVIFDNTVEARLERMRGEIRREILRRILPS
ncbi:MAG: V-type ATP synthase subunit E family protein [Nitrososphaerota archaeon]